MSKTFVDMGSQVQCNEVLNGGTVGSRILEKKYSPPYGNGLISNVYYEYVDFCGHNLQCDFLGVVFDNCDFSGLDMNEIKMTDRIHLGPKEWDNDTMRKVAKEFIDANPGETPLVVTVYEHGGWALGFAMIDGELEVINSANGSAVYRDKIMAFKKAIYHAKWVDYPEIRRS